MASSNPFDLLGDDDNDDPSQLIAAAQQQKAAAATAAAKKPAAAASAPEKPSAKLPSKPLPPSQAVKEARDSRNSTGPPRGGGAGRGGPGRGRGGRGPPNRDDRDGTSNVFAGANELDTSNGQPVERERGGGYGGPRQLPHGRRRGGYGNSDESDRPRRIYERHSGTGRGYEFKREGAGRGNWGTTTDEVLAQAESEEVVNDDNVNNSEKMTELEDGAALKGNKDNADVAANETEKEPEENEMTLEEYEKVREEKRKALLAMKGEERKVEPDQELQSMQQLSLKKGNDEFFVKLGSDKDKGRKKENTDQDERAKKLSINEFLKPAEGERYYGGRGRGRGRGDRPFRGGYGGGASGNTAAPSIEDPGQFPILGK